MKNLDQVISDFGLWFYLEGPSPDTWTQLLVGGFLALGAIYTTILVAPHVTLLNKKRTKRILNAKKKRQKLYKKLKRLRWWQADEAQKEEKKSVILELARIFGPGIFILAILLLSAIWFLKKSNEQLDITESELKTAVQEMVEIHDERLQGLKRKSVPSKYHPLRCNELGITPPINPIDDSSERCATVQSGDDYRTFSEWECGERATLYSEELWYEGFSEFDRITATITKYKLCMLEKGWLTEWCSHEDEQLGRCKAITFRESQCLVETRKWLGGEKDSQPCREAISWFQRSRQEPSNTQW